MSSFFKLYSIDEKMHMDLLNDASVFHPVTKIDSSLSSGSYDLLSYDFGTKTVQGYLAESILPVERRKVDDGSVVPGFATVLEVNWLSVMKYETISEVERDYWRWFGVNDGHKDPLAEVPDYDVDNPDDIFAQHAR